MISRVERGEKIVTHDLLEEFVEALRSPRLRLQTMGGAIPCMYLENVDMSPVAVQQKAIEEMHEAMNCLEELNLINKIGPEDLSEKEKEQLLKETMMELQDVNICMDLILVSLSERYDIDLDKLKKMSRRKMKDRGYTEGLAVAK